MDFRLEKQDAVEFLLELVPASVDLIITDPAYESLEKHRKKGTTTRLKQSKASSNKWFPIFHNDRFHPFFVAAYQALAKNAHLYMYCDFETMYYVKPVAESVGFKVWNPLIWDKKRIGMGYHYRSRYEFIHFFEKGKRKLANLGVSNIIEVPRVWKGYPTEKPVEVSEVLVQQSSEQGECVVDPFVGSGSVGVAALKHGRRFWGCDIVETAVRAAIERLQGGTDGSQCKLFEETVRTPSDS